jgi:glyoxylase-like metal-dependent hydrolase (beta-lactamase superfamily II)
MVTVGVVAPGIWWLAGGSHHSVLVEFVDHMTLIEAPQNDARTLAVIAKAREIKPDKPLTHVVNSHHHFDHSGGIRAAISEGLTVIAHKASAQYFQDSAARPHTIVPDALAKKPMPAKVEAVDEELEIKDATRTVNLYRIAGSPHAVTLLMAHFPQERILVLADVYTPGAALSPYAPNLMQNITTRKLRVDRIVPLHGMIGPYSDLVKVVQSAKPATAN